jgi:hypothetical protein
MIPFGLIYWIEPGHVVSHFKVFLPPNALPLMQNFCKMWQMVIIMVIMMVIIWKV